MQAGVTLSGENVPGGIFFVLALQSCLSGGAAVGCAQTLEKFR
jgi:hypothetical protein